VFRLACASFATMLALSAALSIAAPPQEVAEPIAKDLAAKVSIDVDETTLSSVARLLDDQSDLTFWVHADLHSATVSLNMKQTPVAEALEQIRNAETYVPIDWDVNGRVIKIIPQSVHDQQYRRVEIYDIGSQLLPVLNYSPAEFDLTSVSSDSGSIFSDVAGTDETMDRAYAERTSALMELIRSSVEPDEWRAAGGLLCTMEELNGQLIVSAPPRIHEQVDELLDLLNSARESMIMLDIRLLALPTDQVDATLSDRDQGPLLTPSGLETLMTEGKKRLLARTSVVCLSGQRIGATAGSYQAYAAQAYPTVDTAAVAYTTKVEELYSGLIVLAQPTLNRDGRSVDMNVEANATRGRLERVRALVAATRAAIVPGKGLVDAEQNDDQIDGELRMKPPVNVQPSASMAKYDLPDVDVVRFRSRARVADGGALMLPASGGAGQMTHDGETLVLLIQPRVVRAAAGEE